MYLEYIYFKTSIPKEKDNSIEKSTKALNRQFTRVYIDAQ